jgi:hypothetical protein
MQAFLDTCGNFAAEMQADLTGLIGKMKVDSDQCSLILAAVVSTNLSSHSILTDGNNLFASTDSPGQTMRYSGWIQAHR